MKIKAKNENEYKSQKTELLNKLETLNSKLPELWAVDQFINKHAYALLTICKNVRKNWADGQHLEIQTDVNYFSVYATTNINGLINDQFNNKQRINPETVIMFQGAREKCFVLVKYSEIKNPEMFNYIEEINGSVEIYGQASNNYKPKGMKHYWNHVGKGQSKQIYSGNKLTDFKNCSLVALCMAKSRSKGGRNGSREDKQKAGSLGGKKGLSVKLEFHNAMGCKLDIKNGKDAFNIAVSYGYTKSKRSFYNDLNSGAEIKLVHLNKKSSLCITLSTCTKQVNRLNNIYKEEVLNLNKEEVLNNSNISINLLNAKQEEKTTIKKPQLREHEQEWLDLCKAWDNEPEMCWAYEEFIQIKKENKKAA